MAKQQTTSEITKPVEGEIVERHSDSEQKGIKALLEMKRDAMAAVATAYLSADKLIKIVGVAMSRTPLLLQCEPITVLNSVMTLAELGLSPGPLGEAYLIPFRNGKTGRYECQLIIGYRGLLKLVRRSGEISTISAEVVYDGDDWDLEFGLNARLVHKPKFDAQGSRAIKLAYAIARFNDGGHQLSVMTKDEIDGIRKRSKASGNGPWVSDFSEMAKKTVLRRLCKLLPLTPDAEHQIAVQDRTEFDFDDISSPVEPAPTGAEGLAGRMLADEPETTDPELEPAGESLIPN